MDTSLNATLRRACALALTMALSAALAFWLTPRTYLADQLARGKLADAVPTSFGQWAIDNSVVPVPPSPDLQQVLDETYDETLALTFRNRAGQRIMLSLAYGRNQHKGMNTHRPEVCYPAQGFKILQGSTSTTLNVDSRPITATHVVAAMAGRNEPITYWLVVGDQVTQFGYPQRAVTIRYGLRGLIPDGVLVRVSSIDKDNRSAFELQAQFISELLASMAPLDRARLTGSV